MENDVMLHIVLDELELLKKRIIDNHIRANQVASGRTMKSLNVETTESGAALFGRKAFGVLETGRGPGKVPKGFYQIIQEWVRNKGIQLDKPKSFSYLLARKIAREGTALYSSADKENIYSKEIPETIDNISNRILGIMEMKVKHININASK